MTNESINLLSMFQHPVLLVVNGIITDINQAAKQLQFSVNTPITGWIETGSDEYAAYHSGYLTLGLSAEGIPHTAVVIRTEIGDFFHLQSETETAEFRTMALVAQRLRQPLTGLLTNADILFPEESIQRNPELRQRAAEMNRNLYQLLREVSNLSSATPKASVDLQLCDVNALVCETIEKIQSIPRSAGQKICYTSTREDIYSLICDELLERALHNMLSNACKFSPADSEITVKLERFRNKFQLSVQNRCQPDVDTDNLFFRYLRDPAIEDSRYGIGLGLVMIQNAAIAHGGCLLLDHPQQDSVRFTLTIPIRQNENSNICSPVLRFDYLGGIDHTLVELSDVLSPAAFTDIN